MGCVNVYYHTTFEGAGIVPPTKQEWLEWAFWELQLEMDQAVSLLERFICTGSDKPIPTLSEHKNRLHLIGETKKWLKDRER